MGKIWNISVWGVRGGNQVSAADFLEYGGNTSCISARYGKCLAVLDAGSGLAKLGEALRQEGRKRADILLGHLHLDHVIGLFHFPLLYDAEASVHLYGEARNGVSFQKQLETLIGAPYWPLGLSDFKAKVVIHEIQAETCFRIPDSETCFRIPDSETGEEDQTDGIVVHTLRAKHPNQCLLYRLEAGGRSIVYALDCELDEMMLQKLYEFSNNCDLIVWDANFTEKELPLRKGWGHSSWQDGIALRRMSGAKKILMSHFSTSYADSFLREQEQIARQTDTNCYFAKEGMEIQI